MDTKKLDKWADLLLDTGKRNNLINFKDTRASTVEVLLPTADALFEKIDGSTSFEVFDPKIIEEDEDRGYTRIAEPIGIIAGIVPCTNPTATAIFKSLYARLVLMFIIIYQLMTLAEIISYFDTPYTTPQTSSILPSMGWRA